MPLPPEKNLLPCNFPPDNPLLHYSLNNWRSHYCPAEYLTTDNYPQIIATGKLPPDNGPQINGFHVIVHR